jgi:hypothetical protein
MLNSISLPIREIRAFVAGALGWQWCETCQAFRPKDHECW